MPVRFLGGIALLLIGFSLASSGNSAAAQPAAQKEKGKGNPYPPEASKAPDAKNKKPFNPFDEPEIVVPPKPLDPEDKAKLPTLKKLTLEERKQLDEIVVEGIRARRVVEILTKDPPAYWKQPGYKDLWAKMRPEATTDEQKVIDAIPTQLGRLVNATVQECLDDTMGRLPSAKLLLTVKIVPAMGFIGDGKNPEYHSRDALVAAKNAALEKYDGKLNDRATAELQTLWEQIVLKDVRLTVSRAQIAVIQHKYYIRAKEESADQK